MKNEREREKNTSNRASFPNCWKFLIVESRCNRMCKWNVSGECVSVSVNSGNGGAVSVRVAAGYRRGEGGSGMRESHSRLWSKVRRTYVHTRAHTWRCSGRPRGRNTEPEKGAPSSRGTTERARRGTSTSKTASERTRASLDGERACLSRWWAAARCPRLRETKRERQGSDCSTSVTRGRKREAGETRVGMLEEKREREGVRFYTVQMSRDEQRGRRHGVEWTGRRREEERKREAYQGRWNEQRGIKGRRQAPGTMAVCIPENLVLPVY